MSVTNFEGVVQYRLLGSHPAASGRYYTTGFPGNTISVREFTMRLINEHRINVRRYKLEIKKVFTDKESERSNVHEQLMGENDFICSYDRLAVTISQRQVGEPFIVTNENSEREWNDRNGKDYNNEQLPIAELELMRYTEQPRSESLQGNSLLHSSGNLQHDICSNTNSDNVNNSMNRSALDSENTYHNELPARHSNDNKPLMPSATRSPAEQISTTLVRATEHDNRALERIAIVAGKVLPIKSREHITLEASASKRNDHICILCDLPPFQPRRTTCCQYIVCNMCWLTAQNMMPHDGDCPVCGAEALEISLRRNSKRTRNVESYNIYDTANSNINNYNKESQERTKCDYENVKNEQIEEKFDSKFTHDMHDKESEKIADIDAFVFCDNGGSNCTKSANERSQTTVPLQTNEENNELIHMRKTSPIDKFILSEITPEVIAFERQLRLNLDKTLSFLDLCDNDRKKESLNSETDSNIKDKRHKFISKENTLYSEHSAVLRRADALFLLTEHF